MMILLMSRAMIVLDNEHEILKSDKFCQREFILLYYILLFLEIGNDQEKGRLQEKESSFYK